MSTDGAVVAGLVVLAVAGACPVVVLVGWRWYAIPIAPLAGAAIAGISVTISLGVVGSLALWFPLLSAVAAAVSLAYTWWQAGRPLRWPRRPVPTGRREYPQGHYVIGLLGVLAIVATTVWCLHSLSDPTVGFDARSVWITRAGWFIAPHGRFDTDMRSAAGFLPQETYPPLVSAAVAVVWWVTGTRSDRVAVEVIAVLNVCALGAAAFVAVELGRQAWRRTWAWNREPDDQLVAVPGATSVPAGVHVIPAVVGLVLAPLLVVTAYGLAEPFMTNGYADPLWSLAALGAVVYGLQVAGGRSNYRAALILAVVAGTSKEEGAATAACIVVLIVARRLAQIPATDRWRAWWRPILHGTVCVALIGAWPVTVKLLGFSTSVPPGPRVGSLVTRARQTFDGSSPYLHVVLVALVVAIVGAALLASVRRAIGVGNDLWPWIVMTVAFVVIGYTYVFGAANIPSWLSSTVTRVIDLERFLAWWILGGWAITAAAAPAWRRLLVREQHPARRQPTVLPSQPRGSSRLAGAEPGRSQE